MHVGWVINDWVHAVLGTRNQGLGACGNGAMHVGCVISVWVHAVCSWEHDKQELGACGDSAVHVGWVISVWVHAVMGTRKQGLGACGDNAVHVGWFRLLPCRLFSAILLDAAGAASSLLHLLFGMCQLVFGLRERGRSVFGV